MQRSSVEVSLDHRPSTGRRQYESVGRSRRESGLSPLSDASSSERPILIELVQCLVVAGKHQEALDEIELYLPSHPYQDNPILQIYTGFLSLYIAQEFPKDSARHSTLLEDAKSRLRRAKEIDPNNIVAQTFIEKITTLNEDHSPEPDSELEMEVDEGIGPKTKRART